MAAHALALAVLCVELVARAARVVLVARGLDVRLDLLTSLRAQLAGDALGAATPFRAGSDPAKIATLGRSGVGVGVCGALLLAEMGAEAVTLLACATVVVATAPAMGWVALGLVGYVAFVSAAGLGAVLLLRRPSQTPPRLWTVLRLGAGRWAASRGAVLEFQTNARRLRHLPARWAAGAFAATLVHVAARAAILPILVLTLAASTSAVTANGIAAELVLRPLFVLYATALVPPPGGGGVVEVAFAATLSGPLGPAGLAATLLWWRIYTFYFGAAAGALVLLGARLGLGAQEPGRVAAHRSGTARLAPLPTDTGSSANGHTHFSTSTADA
jgi:uncharacterized membrane protein YbhN (UPF0104 family)